MTRHSQRVCLSYAHSVVGLLPRCLPHIEQGRSLSRLLQTSHSGLHYTSHSQAAALSYVSQSVQTRKLTISLPNRIPFQTENTQHQVQSDEFPPLIMTRILYKFHLWVQSPTGTVPPRSRSTVFALQHHMAHRPEAHKPSYLGGW